MARKQHRAILLQDVDHLGARGDVVSVKSGYLRNYLVPRRLAEQATEARIAENTQFVGGRDGGGGGGGGGERPSGDFAPAGAAPMPTSAPIADDDDIPF